MEIMITAIAIALAGIYALIWAYILFGHFREQRDAVKNFIAAWENDTYDVHGVNSDTYSEIIGVVAQLRISFPAGKSQQYVYINPESGCLISTIKWGSDESSSITPNWWVRRSLEEYTTQIATMFKLESELAVPADKIPDMNTFTNFSQARWKTP